MPRTQLKFRLSSQKRFLLINLITRSFFLFTFSLSTNGFGCFLLFREENEYVLELKGLTPTGLLPVGALQEGRRGLRTGEHDFFYNFEFLFRLLAIGLHPRLAGRLNRDESSISLGLKILIFC